MAGICDGADCLGLSTNLNGANCLTQDVQCRDGKMVVASQGVRQRRFSAGTESTGSTFPVGGIDLVAGTDIINNGPYSATGPLLSVQVTNPFCTTASAVFHCEFAADVRVANSDIFELHGSANISGGGATFVDSQPPFTADTFPTSYGGIGLFADRPFAVADSGELYEELRHATYTVLGTIPAGAVFTFEMLAEVRIAPRGPLRRIAGYSVAVSILLSPTL